MAATGPNRGEKASLPLHAVPSDSRSVLSSLPRYARRVKTTYTATITTPNALTAIMSALGNGKPSRPPTANLEFPFDGDDWHTFKYARPYERGRYDVLCMPGSFPYGGFVHSVCYVYIKKGNETFLILLFHTSLLPFASPTRTRSSLVARLWLKSWALFREMGRKSP